MRWTPRKREEEKASVKTRLEKEQGEETELTSSQSLVVRHLIEKDEYIRFDSCIRKIERRRGQAHLSSDPSFKSVLELLSTFLSSLDALVTSRGDDIGSEKTKSRIRSYVRGGRNEGKEEKEPQTHLGTSVARSSSQTPTTPTSATSS